MSGIRNASEEHKRDVFFLTAIMSCAVFWNLNAAWNKDFLKAVCMHADENTKENNETFKNFLSNFLDKIFPTLEQPVGSSNSSPELTVHSTVKEGTIKKFISFYKNMYDFCITNEKILDEVIQKFKAEEFEIEDQEFKDIYQINKIDVFNLISGIRISLFNHTVTKSLRDLQEDVYVPFTSSSSSALQDAAMSTGTPTQQFFSAAKPRTLSVSTAMSIEQGLSDLAGKDLDLEDIPEAVADEKTRNRANSMMSVMQNDLSSMRFPFEEEELPSLKESSSFLSHPDDVRKSLTSAFSTFQAANNAESATIWNIAEETRPAATLLEPKPAPGSSLARNELNPEPKAAPNASTKTKKGHNKSKKKKNKNKA